MSLAEIKKRANVHQVTVNDFILGCIAKATCIYSQGSQERITISISASMHQVDENLDKFKPSNKVIGVPIILRLKVELPAAIEEASKATVCLRDSIFVQVLYNDINYWLNYFPRDTFNNKAALTEIKQFAEEN